MNTLHRLCRNFRRTSWLIALPLGAWITPSQAAALVFTLAPSGGSIVGTLSGSVNLGGGLTPAGSYGSSGGSMWPATGSFNAGGPSATMTIYALIGLGGPGDFGSGDLTPATSGDGDPFYFEGFEGWLALPNGYSTGAPLSGTTTWSGATLASLGVTPGTYTWTWGTGESATVIVVPEPHECAAIVGLGLFGYGFWRRQGRR